ncbi:hypothetical protein PoHVEF18_004090 [Penicillium ochrochloron]
MTIGEQKALLDRKAQDEEALEVSKGLTIGKLAMAALLLANADETFVLSTGSDVASALNASADVLAQSDMLSLVVSSQDLEVPG